jgi:NADPH-dependent F420 reductase
MSQDSRIGIIGGTGKEGLGLAFRWARAGYGVAIGSRMPEKAAAAAAKTNERLAEATASSRSPSVLPVAGMGNTDAARWADICVIAVPYAAHASTLADIRAMVQGKLVIDVTVPLVPPKVSRVQMPPDGSAALEARRVLGDGVEIAEACQNISQAVLAGQTDADCDVLVTGSTADARDRALKLVEAAGLRGWDAGPLENSAVVEGLTSVLLHINHRYGSRHAGIRVTGVEA